MRVFSMAKMRALVKSGRDVGLRLVPVPEPRRGEVRVGVRLAGLCRTDVQVALGQLPAADPIILGHEFAGVVDALGPNVTEPRPGQRVAVLPVLGCADCPVCRAGDAINCPRRTMLGVDRDGAFAEFVCVPSACVYPLPDDMADGVAAYAEPVAAALAVLDGGIHPKQRGLVLGRNRFAVLIERLLRAHGFAVIETDAGRWPDDSFDFLIETRLDEGIVAEMIRLARPGATLLMKSRRPGSIAVPVLPLLSKRLTLRGLNYGCFRTAIRLLADGALDLSDLLGPVERLENFAALCDRAGGEAVKFFLDPRRGDVRRSG
jgi:L-iditol 2-dehydrogenase